MQTRLKLLVAVLAFTLVASSHPAWAADEATQMQALMENADAPVQMDTMEIKGVAASVPAIPANLPASSEGVSATQIDESVNAVSSGEVLKYLPSVHVRERFSGDVNGGLAIRMTGVNQSAENIVYADGMLLSNFLNNSCCPGPRWGMVTPEEIDRVDVVYGPFSALYPGNAEGGVVLVSTHMPRKFEAHAKVDALSENFNLYGTDKNYSGLHGAAELGDKVGNWSFWVNVDRLDNTSHPTDFVVASAKKGAPATAGHYTVVNGAVTDLTLNNAPRVITGSLSTDHTVKDDVKIKLGYDFSPTIRATYTFDNWKNTSNKTTDSYLTDAATGNVIYGTGGTGVYQYVRINGQDYTAAPTGSNELQDFSMHGLSVKSDMGGKWDWGVVASLFNYDKDALRTSGSASGTTPAALATGGTINFTDGTGWRNLDLRGEFRPDGDRKSEHQLSFGYHTNTYVTKSDTYNLVTGTNWLTDATGAKTLSSRGKTETQAIYLQDAWQLAPAWQLVGGGRLEHWQAFDGRNFTTANGTVAYQRSAVSAFSPKFALSYQVNQDLILRASLGRANRFPTVQELFANTGITDLSTGAAATAVVLATLPAPYNTQLNNNPNLKPEVDDAWEFTAEKIIEHGVWRNSIFGEEKKGALISQANTTTLPGFSISGTQNVDKIRSYGFESAFQTKDMLIHGLDLSGSVAYIHSMIVSDVANPLLENTVQPLIPMWRGSLVATYHASKKLSCTLADRFSGRQHSGLFNTTTKAYPDPNPNVYGGRSTFNVLDAKVLYKVNKQWSASAGVNNIGNVKYFTLYPYAQRTLFASLKFDL
ncbi:MAG: TonB-dependent receptor [Nitrosomonadales bacterium]|nr:TonB-dependent receptor [Nitrosomonadales bacterium]